MQVIVNKNKNEDEQVEPIFSTGLSGGHDEACCAKRNDLEQGVRDTIWSS